MENFSDFQKKIQQGHIFIAVLTFSGVTYSMYEVSAVDCGNCDKIHMTWFQDGRQMAGNCDPDNLGKPYIHITAIDESIEARMLQLKPYSQEKAKPLFCAAFAEWLQSMDDSISKFTKALL